MCVFLDARRAIISVDIVFFFFFFMVDCTVAPFHTGYLAFRLFYFMVDSWSFHSHRLLCVPTAAYFAHPLRCRPVRSGYSTLLAFQRQRNTCIADGVFVALRFPFPYTEEMAIAHPFAQLDRVSASRPRRF